MYNFCSINIYLFRKLKYVNDEIYRLLTAHLISIVAKEYFSKEICIVFESGNNS